MIAIYEIHTEGECDTGPEHIALDNWATQQKQTCKWYQDGGDPDQPGLNQLLEDIKHGQVNRLAVYSLSRLMHKAQYLGDFLEWLHALDVSVMILAEGIDTATEEGQRFIQWALAIGKMEVIIRGAEYKWPAALRNLLRSINGGRPYGSGKKHDPVLVDRVMRMFRAGYTLAGIGKQMNIARRTVYTIVQEYQANMIERRTRKVQDKKKERQLHDRL